MGVINLDSEALWDRLGSSSSASDGSSISESAPPLCYLLIILSVLESFLFFGLPQPPNSSLGGSLSPTKCSTLL